VKISPRKAANAAAQRRIDLQVERAKTSTVRDAFPDIGVIQIHLGFSESHPPPSPQTHSLYPAAIAFFRFACPCVDCDGEFDLAAAVAELASAGAPAKRAGRSVTGRSHCAGVHWRESNHSEPCRIELNYRVVVSFAT
jgi:hypothetical protein